MKMFEHIRDQQLFNKLMSKLEYECCNDDECYDEENDAYYDNECPRNSEHIRYEFISAKYIERSNMYCVTFNCVCKDCGWEEEYDIEIIKNEKTYHMDEQTVNALISLFHPTFKIEVIE